MWSRRKVLVKRDEKAQGLLSYVKYLWPKHKMLKCFSSQEKQHVKKPTYTTS